MMNDQHIDELIEKYIQKTATLSEQQELQDWFYDQNREEVVWADGDSAAELDEDELIKKRMLLHIQARMQPKEGNVNRIKLYRRIAAAAAVMLVVGLSIFFYSHYTNTLRHLEGSAATRDLANDIKPGGNKAYLVLSNGKRLSLTDAANGELAREAGVEITKTADGQVAYKTTSDISGRINGRHPELDSGPPNDALNTIETPRGGQYLVRLPDGSKVWLNAASKLIYPVSFNGRGQRVVELSGEAYFEIFKNKLQPFVVKSKNQEVTVLGTHFNVNSYSDEPDTKTTLLEGSVRVNEAVLKPGQQSILTGGKINIVLADLDEVMAWQKGDFVFKNEPLESIMKKISRWYDVEVVYAEGAPKNITLVGLVSRSRNLSAVLKMMEMTKKVKFKVEGKKVTVLEVKK